MAAINLKNQTVVNFDDPSVPQCTVVLAFRGVRVALDRERIEHLLDLEQRFLASLVDLPVVGDDSRTSGGTSAPRPRQLPTETVSHASLSSRVTKVHKYSCASRLIRPAHAGILGEFLAAFDWVLPEHSNGRLAVLLADIQGWDGLPPALAAQITDFLSRYELARGAQP